MQSVPELEPEAPLFVISGSTMKSTLHPFLHQGQNTIYVVVPRFSYSTVYAPTFPRLPVGGLRMVSASSSFEDWSQDAASWETAIDYNCVLRVEVPEDDFSHVYEQVEARSI